MYSFVQKGNFWARIKSIKTTDPLINIALTLFQVPYQNNLREEEEILDPRIKFGLGVKPKPTWHKHQHDEHEHEHHHHHHHSEYHHEQLNQPLLPPQPPPLPPPPPPPPPPAPAPVSQIPEELSRMLGMTPSDIDKYSRIFFPITFTCFQLMYWIIYNHLSDDETLDGLIFFNSKWRQKCSQRLVHPSVLSLDLLKTIKK